MLLCIDSGNTNIVFAVFDDEDKPRGQWRSSSRGERTADEFGVWLGQLMDKAGALARLKGAVKLRRPARPSSTSCLLPIPA